jgi:hypothetical protein
MLAKLTSKESDNHSKGCPLQLPKVEYFEVELNEGKVIPKFTNSLP